MLKSLLIQNVALIDELKIDFEKKLNVLSGETGAGKSIVIDALNFVLGARTQKSLIKQNKDYMSVSANFSVDENNDKARFVLERYGISCDDDLILSKKLTIDGKTDIRINGVVCNNSMLKDLSSCLIDIHGQHEHQHLLKESYHIDIIDNFIKDKVLFETLKVKICDLNAINKNIKSLNGSFENQERLLDLLDYQIKEIRDAKLKPNEDDELIQKKILMQNSEKIYSVLEETYQIIGSDKITDSIKHSSSNLFSISKYDNEFSTLHDRLDSVKFELIDIADTVKTKLGELSFNQIEYDEIIDRLDKINTLKKKYGPTLDDVLKFYEKAVSDFDDISNSKVKLKKFLIDKEHLLEEIFSLCKKISEKRRAVASEFEKQVKVELCDLGMKNSQFSVDFSDFPSIENFESTLTEKGCENIRFLFSANIGQSLKPLSEIISGGEASRFMLALKNILAEYDGVSSMVFDEIDTGISGEMGYKVACKMANIAMKHQVIAVSHLPQICAMADTNFKVEKYSFDKDTYVNVSRIADKELLNEIARLSGGIENNYASIEHAKELKIRCDSYKGKI